MSDSKATAGQGANTKEKERVIKVLAWDLDLTLWNGVLPEGDDVKLRPGVEETLKTLDSRGILQSIASKNDFDHAMGKLRELGVDEYFIYPQINWGTKSAMVEHIAKSINVGLDAVALIDDQPFEREEVGHAHPQVLTYALEELDELTTKPELIPRFITDESAIRRKMYQADIARNRVEQNFEGPQEDFLSTLDMKFNLGPAREEDLKRAEELTVRTNQLNATGRTYNYDELNEFRQSDDHLLMVASLDDKYGVYGKIGLALIEKQPEVWTLRLLLMSCRVMARGVGTIMMSYILNLAKEAGVRFLAEFRTTDRNRMMLVTYKFANFKEIERHGDIILFEHDLQNIQPFPDYVEVKVTT